MNIRWLLPLLVVSLLPAQRKRAPRDPAAGRLITEFPVPDVPPLDVAAASQKAIEGVLKLQEDGSQWPYEGVYREDRGLLPVGYRVGGTAITIMGLVSSPGYHKHPERVAAVGRGIQFVVETLDHERMQAGARYGTSARASEGGSQGSPRVHTTCESMLHSYFGVITTAVKTVGGGFCASRAIA